ncbi:glucosamine-fructose-6-phosphate aminotransferase [isomerizing] protein, putative (macronuclear) [Tetrahymena thermophila SB210]|uniref:Glutamine--fructose-6-phosphate aminotransferase [isomerizing] n=1 Tax=Tetrahymena thermophila (strain SB210) TaxID=312017 RepID=Q22XS4_TETTS|nr:glucosamine-fructose-6-phosphate aminotransferase [isomerizing] protein, putative [Tetrahymena thermophila SB210]EAR90097.2 glucosamine-fructose-6-phosphate aminotransferase [isomerizing] protein, putative [Tetrahymena thermophila SB210]|eukprot:XP_001010342.2 glucosamine-fructose-6-phosphate aminotransferase [isomerizing] protein, putative [Tetrahymena thermophila SB210]
MCGIIGVLTQKTDAEVAVLEGIELLQNRGYDSAGIASIKAGETEFTLTKLASDSIKKIDCIDVLKEVIPQKHKNSYIGIGHTRWATCGGKTDQNAHPHFDQDQRIMLCHNGTLDNFTDIRSELISQGIKLSSETDSELIAQLIALELKSDESLTTFKAVRRVIQNKLQGQWGLVIIDKCNPESLIVARNGSPILVGIATDSIYVASEKIAFEKYTSNYILLQDGELMEFNLKNMSEFYKNNKDRIQVIKEKNEVQIAPKSPYKHFFEQEIFEQPETLLKTFSNGARLLQENRPKLGGLEPYQKDIANVKNMVIVACGSSYYAGVYANNFFKKLKCFNSCQVIEASEFTVYDLPDEDGGMICISQSGETADVRHCLQLAQEKGLFTIGVVNTVGSQIATSVNCGVYVHCGREVAVAATKSFTSQCVSLIMIAAWISSVKEEQNKTHLHDRVRPLLIQSLRSIPTHVGITLYQVKEQVKPIAQHLASHDHIIILGKGSCSSIAKEGALKLKELTYIHAEAFSAGELKHGPLALINCEKPKSTAVILIILDDEYYHDMSLALSEVHSRGAYTIVITNCLKKLAVDKVDASIQIEQKDMLSSLMCVLPLQLLTYEICTVLETNPDKPRNLAKCVTVK